MKLTQAILPLAGLGTRFLPWTKGIPKEMLPIGTKPIVALLVDECLSVGITDICFVISRGKEVIPEFFYEDQALEEELKRRGKDHMLAELERYDAVNFHTVYQHEQLGDGHAILQAVDWVNSDQVAVLFGDDLIVGEKTGLEQMKEAMILSTQLHSSRVESRVGQWMELRDDAASLPPMLRFGRAGEESVGAMLCLQDVPKEKVSSYGIADVEDGDGSIKTIKGLVEKPNPEEAPSTLGVVGKYLLPKSIFDVLSKVGASHKGEIRVIDALIAQLDSLPIYGCVFEGKRYDTGTPEGYRKAVIELG